jgi:hypothetical protein
LRALFCIALLSWPLAAVPQEPETRTMSGIAVNLADPDKPLAAKVEFRVQNGACTVLVFAPLFGSGPCHIKLLDRATHRTEIISDGPPAIVWTGTTKGNFFSGSYLISGTQQTGSFYLASLKPHSPPAAVPKPEYGPVRSSCVPAVEASINGEFHGWDGETIFKLDNGQIWQQAEYDYNYDYDYSPDVTIYSTSSGCKMKVEGEDETVLVKRIK